MVQEGSLSEDIFIVRKGSFSGFRTYQSVGKPNAMQQNESVKQFLDSDQAKLKRNLRGVFNLKIMSLTKMD